MSSPGGREGRMRDFGFGLFEQTTQLWKLESVGLRRAINNSIGDWCLPISKCRCCQQALPALQDDSNYTRCSPVGILSIVWSINVKGGCGSIPQTADGLQRITKPKRHYYTRNYVTSIYGIYRIYRSNRSDRLTPSLRKKALLLLCIYKLIISSVSSHSIIVP